MNDDKPAVSADTKPRPEIRRGAQVSDCGRYRYTLMRRWSDAPPLGWVMLNPSTADASIDDPTIRRCMGFAQRDGFGGICVVNLFAVRLTDSRQLTHTVMPFGPLQRATIDAFADVIKTVVVAWGAHPMAAGAWKHMLAERVPDPLCLGTTKDGSPRHPLYVRGDQPFLPWRRAAE